MEKSITTAIMTIAAATVSLLLVNALVPRVHSGSTAAGAAAARLEERVRTDLTIVHAAHETVNNTNYVRVWVKNTGSGTIAAIDKMNVFLTSSSGTSYIPYGSGSGKWQYATLDSVSGEWTSGITSRIDITLASAASGTYTILLSTASGADVSRSFSF